ncbi:MAG: 23S rRNA (adenine(2503)-C(2))-methyltransferase RlmN [Rickettsiales bacterium]|jgi:23S rRNA (adenine2503-C2)-methyltransferase|nr:23S rRNA (adenine(2503)-C(2))-methyltransferase RlmN [Rickettsiales bacterium]
MENLFSKSLPEIEKIVADMGEPGFRARQIRDWLDKGIPDFSHMKNMPAALRQKLSESFQSLPIKDERVLHSADGATAKFLFALSDREKIETVLMRTSYGNSVCVSSQAGCAMGCRFCASALFGLKRNLTADEMYAEVLRCQWELRQGNGTMPNGDVNQNDITHIVVMGTGEPLMNRENTIGFLRRANAELGIGWRKITLSTCGIVPEIMELKKFGEPINLAISLHAPTDELRRQIMPIAGKYKIAEILDAAFGFSAIHNRQLMIEYVLLGGFNDSPEHAEELSRLLKNKLVMVNLIPWNAVAERDWTIPSGNVVHRFQDILLKNGIHTRIRKERGADIASACGQLRISD